MAKPLKLVLIDAHALIHRAYHALPPMNNSQGVPTQAVYGFVAMLLKTLSLLKPTHVVAAFDVAGKTFRHEAYDDYKAHRPKAQEDLVTQFGLVQEVVRAFNIPVIKKQGFEADDIIGTIVQRVGQQAKKYIVTGDMDALQLVDDSTFVFTLKRGVTDTILYDVEAVKNKYTFGPEFVTDYKGLRGDPSDNIPGVAGVGEKTAMEAVSQFGHIENIYKHLDELPPRIQKKLVGQEKAALHSRDLATIRRDVDFDFSLTEAELADYDQEEVRAIFEKLEFRNFLSKLPASNRGDQLSLLSSKKVVEPVTRVMPDNYELVESVTDQKKLRELLNQQSVIAFDTETDGLGARKSPIIGMSFAAKIEGQVRAWYVPVTTDSVKDWQKLLENPKVGKVGHNIKYDLEVLRQSGIQLGPLVFDSMIAAYLLNASGRHYDLDTLAEQELHRHTIHIEELIGTGKNQKSMTDVPLHDLAIYAAEDAEITYLLYETLAPKIAAEKVEHILQELELPLIPVLADMELTGIKIDSQALKTMGKRLAKRLEELKASIWREAGEEFNVNSTQKLRTILFEKLGLSTMGIARKQSGFSTAASELEKLRGQNPIIELLEEYRELSKLKSTYIDTLPELIDPETGRIYTSVSQVVAATGRLSSSDPNLQNIPIRTETGQGIRAAFVAEDGHQLVKADYSQVELRVVAHIAHDEKMLEAFRAGQDIHRSTAAWVYGVAPDKVTDDQRRTAKTLNFGVLYGMGPKKFAATTGLSMEQARSFIGRYQEQYTGITKLIEATIVQAETLGYAETLLGHRRYFPEIKATSPMIRAQAERVAFNFPIQGTAADILKKAMIELHAAIKKDWPKVRLLLTVHDELVCEVPDAQVKKFAAVMKKIMEGVVTLDIPLEVEVAAGPNWRDVEKIKFK